MNIFPTAQRDEALRMETWTNTQADERGSRAERRR